MQTFHAISTTPTGNFTPIRVFVCSLTAACLPVCSTKELA